MDIHVWYGAFFSFSFFLSFIATNQWTLLNITGDAPLGRDLACAALVGDYVVMFGGFMSNQEYASDVWGFNLVTNTWTQFLAVGNKPPPTSGATCGNLAGKLMVFGGGDATQAKTNGLYSFDLDSSTWSKILSNSVSISTDFKYIYLLNDCTYTYQRQDQITR